MKTLTTFLTASFALIVSTFADVTPVKPKEAAAHLKKNPKTVVVDIRTPEEFKEGHLKGAININMRSEDFEEKLAKLDKDKTYLMHCLSGGRSTASIPVWEKLGFEKVLHLDSGMKGWLKEDLPVVKSEEENEKSEEKTEKE